MCDGTTSVPPIKDTAGLKELGLSSIVSSRGHREAPANAHGHRRDRAGILCQHTWRPMLCKAALAACCSAVCLWMSAACARTTDLGPKAVITCAMSTASKHAQHRARLTQHKASVLQAKSHFKLQGNAQVHLGSEQTCFQFLADQHRHFIWLAGHAQHTCSTARLPPPARSVNDKRCCSRGLPQRSTKSLCCLHWSGRGPSSTSGRCLQCPG